MRVLVFTLPRTASTNYCTHLSTTHNLFDVGEPHPLYYGATTGYHNEDAEAHLDQSNELYLDNQNSCMKIHAGHISEYVPYRNKRWLLDTLDATDEIHFLLRKDIQAQIKSYFVANYVSHHIDPKDHTKFIQTAYDSSWQDELVIPDTPDNLALWKDAEMLVHTQLVGLSVLYRTLVDRDPKVVWTEDIVDELPGSKYHRPVKFDWEPEYMFSNDNFYPADIRQIFK